VGERLVQVLDAPIGHDAPWPRGRARGIGVETQLVAADLEAHVEGLIEVRSHAEGLLVPDLGLVEGFDVVDDSAQAEGEGAGGRIGGGHGVSEA
jgi:hypothetical protein